MTKCKALTGSAVKRFMNESFDISVRTGANWEVRLTWSTVWIPS